MKRSATESKNAPRGPVLPDALATAPSSASGIPVATSSTNPRVNQPLPMTTAAAAAMTMPSPVR